MELLQLNIFHSCLDLATLIIYIFILTIHSLPVISPSIYKSITYSFKYGKQEINPEHDLTREQGFKRVFTLANRPGVIKHANVINKAVARVTQVMCYESPGYCTFIGRIQSARLRKNTLYMKVMYKNVYLYFLLFFDHFELFS